MSDKPQITVIYQDAKNSLPGCGTVALEALLFSAFLGGMALIWGWL